MFRCVMADEKIPGDRILATTKHGRLTVDEIAEIIPGMARLMEEVGRRYWTLYYAAKGGNWELAKHMESELEKLLRNAGTVRPKYKEDIAAFIAERLRILSAAIEAHDFRAFDEAYRRGIEASDVYHEKYAKSFIRFRLPDHPPEGLDLGP
jgi:hypothetical protein